MALSADVGVGWIDGKVINATTGDPIPTTVTITPAWATLSDLPGGADTSDRGAILAVPPAQVVIDTSVVAEGGTELWTWECDGAGYFKVAVVAKSDGLGQKNVEYTVKIADKVTPETVYLEGGVEAIVGAIISAAIIPPKQKANGPANRATVTIVTGGGGGGGASTWGELGEIPSIVAALGAAGADKAAARAAIGAGTGSSNLALGTTAGTAKAGDYTPAWGDISGKPATFPATVAVADISGASATGKALLAAPSADAALSGTLGVTTYGRDLVKAADQSAARTVLGVATAVRSAAITDGHLVLTLVDDSTIDVGPVSSTEGPPGDTGATGPQGQAGQGVLILGAPDAVPGGTPAGTLIGRI